MNSIKRSFPPELRALIDNRSDDYRTQLFIDVTAEQVSSILGGVVVNPKHDKERQFKYKDWQERRMLLDYRVVEKSFEIPHKFKYAGPTKRFDKKHILKELAYDYIPREMLSGPKRGFGVPLAKWLRGTLKDEIRQYSDTEFLKKQGLFDAEGVQNLIQTQEHENKIIYSSILWPFYMFQRWWEEYMK